jgi:hypothetical protein
MPLFILTHLPVQIHLGFAPVAAFGASEKMMPAVWANVAGFFILDILFRSHLPPVRYGAQHHPFSHRHGEAFDQAAWKISAFVTACVPFALGAIFDVTFPAIEERRLRQAPTAVYVFRGKIFSSRNFSLVDPYQDFFEFLVVIPCGFEDGANPTIQTARCQVIGIYVHCRSSFPSELRNSAYVMKPHL